jgi:hypothetical protein
MVLHPAVLVKRREEKRREEKRREEERREEKRRAEKRREEKRREEKSREEKRREEGGMSFASNIQQRKRFVPFMRARSARFAAPSR